MNRFCGGQPTRGYASYAHYSEITAQWSQSLPPSHLFIVILWSSVLGYELITT